jgi:hypothetical protein
MRPRTWSMRCLASACGTRRKYVFVLRVRSIGLAIRASRAILLGLLFLLCNNEARHPNCRGAQILSCRPFNSLKIFSDSSLRRRAPMWSDVGASGFPSGQRRRTHYAGTPCTRRARHPSSQSCPCAPLCAGGILVCVREPVAVCTTRALRAACLNQVAGLHIEVRHFA